MGNIAYLCSRESNTLMNMVKNNKKNNNDPWWVIALKVLAYLIGLILAGIGTAEAATMMNIINP